MNESTPDNPGVFALDPERVAHEAEHVIAWPAFAVQVRAPHPIRGDPFQRLVLRVLRAGAAHTGQIASVVLLPKQLVHTILAHAESDGLVGQIAQHTWELIEPGMRLLDDGFAESDPKLGWMYCCALTGTVLPAYSDNPRPREYPLRNAERIERHTDFPDLRRLSVRARIQRMSSWLRKRLAFPEMVGPPPDDDFEDESMGMLGDWAGDDDIETELEATSIPETNEVFEVPAVPTGLIEAVHIAVAFEPGDSIDGLVARCPFNLTDGRMYATRALKVPDPVLKRFGEQIQAETNRRATAAGLAQTELDLQGLIAASPSPFEASILFSDDVGARVKQAHHDLLRARHGSDDPDTALADLRKVLESVVYELGPTPGDAFAVDLHAALPNSGRAVRKYLKRALEGKANVTSNQKQILNNASNTLRKLTCWPSRTHRTMFGRGLVGSILIQLGVADPTLNPRWVRALSRDRSLLAAIDRLTQTLNRSAHGGDCRPTRKQRLETLEECWRELCQIMNALYVPQS